MAAIYAPCEMIIKWFCDILAIMSHSHIFFICPQNNFKILLVAGLLIWQLNTLQVCLLDPELMCTN